MNTAENLIQYDFQAGKISGGNVIERIGIMLMRNAAWMTKSIRFTGFSWAAKLVRTVFPSHRTICTQLTDDAVFEFPYGDAYWGRMLYNGELYCPEVEQFLLGMRDVDYAFIDCGANYGYMSAIVTSRTYGSKPSIAIEADPETYRILQRNAKLNDDRFELVHKAVYSKSGELVNIYGDKHEARSIVPDGGAGTGGMVETLALDDLAKWRKQTGNKPVILKLDVEGVEIEAMRGARKLCKKDCLVLFEDHASDKTHEVTRFFMDELGMRIFAPHEPGCPEIHDINELDAIKKFSRVGYDFLATTSKFWVKEIKLYQKQD